MIMGEKNVNPNSDVKPVDSINAVISLRELAELALIGIFLAVCGSLVTTYW